MALQSLETNPSTDRATLVTLTYGSTPTIVKLTNWNEGLTIGADTFTSVPAMSVSNRRAFNAGIEPEVFEIEIPFTVEPFDTLSTEAAHTVVKVKIEEVDPASASSRREVFFGRIGEVTRKPRGREPFVRAEVKGIKAQLQQADLGIQALSSCVNGFGSDRPGFCEYDREANKSQAIIRNRQSGGIVNRMTALVFTNDLDLTPATYNYGSIRVDGLEIKIRKCYGDGNPGDHTIDLEKVPPASWEGVVADILPGCDKTLPSCIARSQENRRLALGEKMPDYNPAFEEATGA